MKRIYLSLLEKYSKITLIIFLTVLCFFAYNAKNFQLDASSDTLILEQDEDLKNYRKIIEDYGTSDFLIVTFSDKNKILTEKNLFIISSFIEKITSFYWVDTVQSIFDVPLLEVNNQTLTDLVSEVLTIESPNVNLDEAENELLNSPIFKNLIISEDATSTGVLINFKKNEKYEALLKERDSFKYIRVFNIDASVCAIV